MNKRGAGVCFCFISAFLISVKYILIAIDIEGNLNCDHKGFIHIFAVRHIKINN